MPDFERVLDSLEAHVAPTAEPRAYALGKTAGKRIARLQIAGVVAILAAVYLAAVAWRT